MIRVVYGIGGFMCGSFCSAFFGVEGKRGEKADWIDR